MLYLADLFYIAVGLLMIILAIPMIRGKVPPNHWYGFRVRRTLDDPQVWYPVNAYAGKLLLVYGLAIVAAAMLLPLLWPELSTDALAWAMVTILLGGIFIVLLLSWRYLRTL